MNFKIYRDVDRKSLRKIVIELWHDEALVDRTLMFAAWPFARLAARLRRRKKLMLTRGAIMLAMSGK